MPNPTAGLTRQQMVRRHALCLPDQMVLQSVENNFKAGNTKTQVEKDHNGYPTGWVILPGGDKKIIKGKCNHPEDGWCQFDPISDEQWAELVKSGKAKVEPVKEEPKEEELTEVAAEVETDEADTETMAVCPDCGAVEECEYLDDSGDYMRCTECGHTGTTISFQADDDKSEDGDARPAAPSTLQDEPVAEEIDEEPEAEATDEVEDAAEEVSSVDSVSNEAENLRRYYDSLFGR